jgi:hypothetical protein
MQITWLVRIPGVEQLQMPRCGSMGLQEDQCYELSAQGLKIELEQVLDCAGHIRVQRAQVQKI